MVNFESKALELGLLKILEVLKIFEMLSKVLAAVLDMLDLQL